MLILASASPRRRFLLSKLTPSFKIVTPVIDERLLDPSIGPAELAKEESRLKAYAVFSTHPSDMVLACDTIVILDGEILNKPKDRTEAIAMLSRQSGRKEIVLSAYTFISPTREISRTVATGVCFRPLSLKQIEQYVDKFLPFDKAGAYGIQDDFPLIEKIEGSFDNVMGLPTEDLKKHVFNY